MAKGKRSLVLAGYYGCGNAGDEAILGGLLADLRRLAPDRPIVVASGEPARTAAAHGVAAVDRHDVPVLARALEGAALVALSGGVINDYWPRPLSAALARDSGGLPFYVAQCALATAMGLPSMLCGVGVGPLATGEGRELARGALALSARATVRDRASLDELQAAGLAEAELARLEVTADPGWRLPPLPEAAVAPLLAEIGLAPEDRSIGLALRSWDRDGARSEDWLEAVAAALAAPEHAGRPLLLLAFDTADAAVHEALGARLGPERRVVHVRDRAPAELGALLARCDLVLAMRYHAALLASAAGAPVAALAYDAKVAGLLADLGAPDLALAPRAWDAAAIRELLELAPRHPARQRMPAAVEELRQRAERNVELLLAAADAPPAVEPGRRLMGRLLLASALAAWSAHEDRDDRASELERLREQVSQLREQRSLLLTEHAELERRLNELLGTVGYRALSRFWRAARHLFPEGSRQRSLYRWSRGIASRAVGGPDLQAGSRAAPTSPDAPSAIEVRSQLAALADRAAATSASRVVVILSGTPLVESEGQRPTRLALALARRGVPVVFAYWRWDEAEWRPQDRLEEGILQLPLDHVSGQPAAVLGAFAGLRRLLLVELPWPGAFATLAEANAAGWVTVYDVLDDWAEFRRVGQADWYDESFERHVVTAADAVFAVNAPLAERVRALGGTGVEVLPNGVEPGMERVLEPRPLPRGEVTVGYFGYMAGAWFDWELVGEAARRRPGWRFYLIGYGGPENVAIPGNVTLLGRRPHHELAAFAANWDVGIVPFKGERLAIGADPIKTYEYLAMGLPVVTTGVGPPAGAEALVTKAEGVDGFVAAIAAAAETRGGGDAARAAYALGCTWDRRVEVLLAAVDRGTQRVAEKRALCGI